MQGPRDWQAEYAELQKLDGRTVLEATQLEQLGLAAYLAGQESDSIAVHTRAHTVALAKGDTRQAARSAFWVAFVLIGARDITRAAGWGARARRLLDENQHDCVECGYVMLPQAIEQVMSGNLHVAETTFGDAERIGERFADADLTSLARQGRGRALVARGRVSEGVALLDEAMVAVTAGELSPMVSGVVYCNVIAACFDMLDIQRAQAWTEALNEWCKLEPGVVPYRGDCRAYRAEILHLHGRWPEAIDEARRATESLAATNRSGTGIAAYAMAEVHRLRGDASAADEGYRLASEHGRAPQPGLALLRLAQGQRDAARAAIDRVMAEPSHGRQRADVLAAAVEILLASNDLTGAGRAADELKVMANTFDSTWLRAMSAAADGAVQCRAGHAREALAPLRAALTGWHDLDAPYQAACVQVIIGRACWALHDADGARMEWDNAARAFRQCGAAPALAEVEALMQQPLTIDQPVSGVLTAREVEVLRLIAQGKTNRAIARALDISEKTVARHVSNIFTKLDLSTRSAAAAYAFTNRLAP
jgi:DNA-binding CsgD family transcriptional regulator